MSEMKRIAAVLLLLPLLSSLSALRLSAAQPETRAEKRPPNIVFVLADDLGWSELGCYGNRFNETPHLDLLAAQGLRYTQAYAAAPVCSPYRAALLTGQYPARLGIVDYLRPNSANALSTSHVTLAERLRSAGYATGMIGKWHLTGYRRHAAETEVTPRDHGFDWDRGRELQGVANGVNFWPYLDRRTQVRWLDLPKPRLGDREYLVDRMNLEAVEFIERNKNRPFFLYLSHYATHTILHGKPERVEKYRKKHAPGASSKSRCVICRSKGHSGCPLHHWATDHNPHLAAMLESIDDGIGQIVRKLEELGLAENTILIFTSDNGGETNVTSNAPLRGGKSQLYEGGIRVPLLVRWPDGIAGGAVCQQPTINVDFYPTLLEAAGVSPSASHRLDGVSLLPTWRDPRAALVREALYWHYPLDRPHFLGGVSGGAIRQGPWKLIEFFDSDKAELYSLRTDPSERSNVAAQNPAVVKQLKVKLANWRREVGARRASPPLLTEPHRLQFADHFSSGRASPRWWFNEDWSAEGDILKRGAHGKGTTRIFLRKTTLTDAVVRFDFQLQQSQDLRLVTGGGGHYNAVIHIRPDHFYIQTAKDDSGPYFSYRHGECAYRFAPNRWHTMTVEFIGDELVAHVAPKHVAYARHPILKKPRSYFAFQVDEHPAALDNVQILAARPHRQLAKRRAQVLALEGKHPVNKPLEEQYQIQKRNAHEWHYQRDAAYRELVQRVDALDAEKKRRFPAAFRSMKEVKKKMLAERKRLTKEDPRFKKRLHAMHRAARAIDAWLLAQQSGAADLPDSLRKRQLARLRRRYAKDPQHLQLQKAHLAAKAQLERAYPQVFVGDEAIKKTREKRRDALKNDPEFQRLLDQRAAAYRKQQAYLLEKDVRLGKLKRQLEAQP